MSEKMFVVATMHSEYLLEQMSARYYVSSPTERGVHSVYVSTIADGNHFAVPAKFLDEEVSKHVWKYYHREQDAGVLTYYQIHTRDQKSLEDFLDRCANEMINRIEANWLDCEDDHYDFFHSTLEVLCQIALEAQSYDAMRRLRAALIEKHLPHCKFNDDIDEECWLADVIDF